MHFKFLCLRKKVFVVNVSLVMVFSSINLPLLHYGFHTNLTRRNSTEQTGLLYVPDSLNKYSAAVKQF